MTKKEKLVAALKENHEVKVAAALQKQVEAELSATDPAPEDAETLIKANSKNDSTRRL